MSALPAISRLAAAALGYAAKGWHVFPLSVRDKVPLVKGGAGFLGATTDASVIAGWWRETPEANIGLWPGRSGLCVIDVDGPTGEATARELGLLSEPTLQCVTGRADGGRHLYFTRPECLVSNVKLGAGIDVRCDAGYVVLPPSVHPSGALYRWEGTAAEIKPVPPSVLALLERAQRGAGSSAVGRAAEIPFQGAIGEGERNTALTRYAGRLLAKGVPHEETLALVSAVNAAHCRPPLPEPEVGALVASIAAREAGKVRRGPLVLVGESAPAVEGPPTFDALAAAQVEGAREVLARDLSDAPQWAWGDFRFVFGSLLPGDLVVIGALMGNGKTTLLLSQMDAFATAKVPTLYVPLEVDPEVCRVRWAAWKAGLDARHVIRQEWALLPAGARETVECLLADQETDPSVHFVPDRRLTLGALVAWCRRAREEFGCRVVMLDHLHRLDFGADASSHRVVVTEVVRRLKDAARELGLVLIAAAQLNRSPDPIDAYTPPTLSRLKESAGIAEEADVVLMLSRRLRQEMPEKWLARLHTGELTELDLCEPGVMVATCRKHRLDDAALNRRVFLKVESGRLRQMVRALV